MGSSRRWLFALAVALLGSCDAGLVGQDQECASSEECAAGLLCDFGRSPHTCQPMGSLASDLAMRLDAAAADMTGLGDP
jgi:hypothetical protein